MRFPYGEWVDESDVGLGCGRQSLVINPDKAEIYVDDIYDWYDLTPEQAIDFVNAHEFPEDENQDIIDIINEVFPVQQAA